MNPQSNATIVHNAMPEQLNRRRAKRSSVDEGAQRMAKRLSLDKESQVLRVEFSSSKPHAAVAYDTAGKTPTQLDRRRPSRLSLEESVYPRPKRLSLERADLMSSLKPPTAADQDAIRTTKNQFCCPRRATWPSTEKISPRRAKRLSLERDKPLSQSLRLSPAASQHLVHLIEPDGADCEPSCAATARTALCVPNWDVQEVFVHDSPAHYPLAKTSVFVPQASAVNIAVRISAVLRERSIAATYIAAKAHCVCRSSVKFMVRLHRGRGKKYNHGIIVEVQRKKGFDLGYDQDVHAILVAAEGPTLGRRGLGVHVEQSRAAYEDQIHTLADEAEQLRKAHENPIRTCQDHINFQVCPDQVFPSTPQVPRHIYFQTELMQFETKLIPEEGTYFPSLCSDAVKCFRSPFNHSPFHHHPVPEVLD